MNELPRRSESPSATNELPSADKDQNGAAVAASQTDWQDLNAELDRIAASGPAPRPKISRAPTAATEPPPVTAAEGSRPSWLDWALQRQRPRLPPPVSQPLMVLAKAPGQVSPPLAPAGGAWQQQLDVNRALGVVQIPRVYKFAFLGEGRVYCRIWLTNLLLIIVTLGIGWRWARLRSARYILAQTQLLARPAVLQANPSWLPKLKNYLVNQQVFAGDLGGGLPPALPVNRLVRSAVMLLLAVAATAVGAGFLHLYLAPLVALPGLLFVRAYWRASLGKQLINAVEIDGARLSSSLSVRLLLRLYWRGSLTLLLTAGLAWPWVKMRLLRYHIETTRVFACEPELLRVEE